MIGVPAQGIAIIVVGGDWMPYARLMVPVVPSLAWAAVLIAGRLTAYLGQLYS